MTMGFAFFDLDHTLLPHDTQALFCNYVLRRERWRTALHALFLPFALLKAVRLCSTLRAKRAFMGYLWGMPQDRLRKYAVEFANQSAAAWCYPELLAEMERHREAGRQLVLNTASPDFYAREIAHVLGFDYCVSTRTRLADPLSFHPAIQQNNKREAKIPAMCEQVPGVAELTDDQRNAHCYAYTDSSADLPLLNFGRNGVLIHPTPQMVALGINRDWTILHPKRPYSGALGNILSILRQMAGLYPERPPGVTD
jgi:HAD superfamily phosphoserine phosphatase-like hydrolase